MQLKKLDQLGKPYKIYAEVLESGAIDNYEVAYPDLKGGSKPV